MRFNLQRAFVIVFSLSLLLLLVGTLYHWYETRRVDSFVLLRLGIILTGLLIMARAVTSPRREDETERCQRCGGRLYETKRADDRLAVMTCFACGAESARSGKAPPPDAPRPA